MLQDYWGLKNANVTNLFSAAETLVVFYFYANSKE